MPMYGLDMDTGQSLITLILSFRGLSGDRTGPSGPRILRFYDANKF